MFYDIKPNDNIALLSSEGDAVTYKELADNIERLGNNIGERKLAFCLCENSPSSVIGYLSFLNKKSVPLLIDNKIDAVLFENLLEVYTPEYVYLPKEMIEKLQGYEEVDRVSHYSLMRRINSVDIKLDDNLALLLTTSGSTGSPKLVRQSYTNIQSNTEAIVEYLELTAMERPVTTLPMNYTYGLSIINSHLQVGATILMTDYPMNMKAFWSFAMDNRATSFGGVPYTYEMLKRVRFFKLKLPDLRYMTQAGGKLSPELHKEFAQWCQDNGKKFIVMYGQTEATARMGYLPAEKALEKYGSMGKAIPGGRFILRAADGSEIKEDDVVGELIYEGDNVTLGYAQCAEDLSNGDERGGVLETGDMAKMDSDGYYYIVGRKKRFLKIFGNRVNLDEIDRLIKKNFEGLDCASTGIDDHMKTYITDEKLIDQVRQWLTATTHLSETAFEVFYIDAIPLNESGKVIYAQLPT